MLFEWTAVRMGAIWVLSPASLHMSTCRAGPNPPCPQQLHDGRVALNRVLHPLTFQDCVPARFNTLHHPPPCAFAGTCLVPCLLCPRRLDPFPPAPLDTVRPLPSQARAGCCVCCARGVLTVQYQPHLLPAMFYPFCLERRTQACAGRCVCCARGIRRGGGGGGGAAGGGGDVRLRVDAAAGAEHIHVQEVSVCISVCVLGGEGVRGAGRGRTASGDSSCLS